MKLLTFNRICFQSILIFLVVSFSLSLSRASPLSDLKVGLNGRSYPVGVQLVGSAGIGVPLWGDPEQWKYGFARVAVNAATSVVVNRIGVEAQLYPISILGLSVGFDSGVRNFVPKFLNCSSYECTGRVDRAYLKVQMFGAVKEVTFNFNFRTETLHSYASAKPFFDELTLLYGRSSGESVSHFNPVILYRLDDEWKIGATSLYARAWESGGYSNLYGPIATYSDSKYWSFAGGVGMNESVLIHQALTLFFTLQYTIDPSIQVSDLALRKNR